MTGAPRAGRRARRPGRLPGRAAAIDGRDAAAVVVDQASRPDPSRLGFGRPGREMRPVWGDRRSPTGLPSALFVFMARVLADPSNGEIWATRLPVKTAPAAVLADDGGVSDVVPLSRHRRCRPCNQDRDVPGETLDLGLPDQTMTALLGSFSLPGASFWSSCWLGHARRGGVLRHLTRRRRRVLAARRSGVSALDV